MELSGSDNKISVRETAGKEMAQVRGFVLGAAMQMKAALQQC